jgi:hypothetical protein
LRKERRMNNVLHFYQQVNVIQVKWEREIPNGEHPGQPAPELFHDEQTGTCVPRISWVWIASIANEDKRTPSGMIAKAPIRLAATRAREGTHRLATEVRSTPSWRARKKT